MERVNLLLTAPDENITVGDKIEFAIFAKQMLKTGSSVFRFVSDENLKDWKHVVQ